MAGRRRIYAERVPLGELSAHPALGELGRRGVELLAAVRPGEEARAGELVRRARARGVRGGLWPMLEDAAGRWLHAESAARLLPWAARLEEEAAPDLLVLDLEPPIAAVKRLVAGDPLGAWRARVGRPPFPLAAWVRARRVEIYAAVVPPTVLPGAAGRGWRRLLGTPEAGFDRVSPMAYASLLEGYGRGLLRRADALALVHAIARDAARLGARAALSLGATGLGALGDERAWRDPGELEEEVDAARAAGVEDLALFELAGALERPPLGAWLDALCADRPPRRPPSTPRARALHAAAHLIGTPLGIGPPIHTG